MGQGRRRPAGSSYWRYASGFELTAYVVTAGTWKWYETHFEIEDLRQDYLQIRVLELAPEVYVSGQLYEHDVRLLAKQGVRSIMDNRLEDESAGQPSPGDLARVAEELGMTFVHFPVDRSSITKKDAEAFSKACDELERPVLIFSRSGARSTKIWEMAESM